MRLKSLEWVYTNGKRIFVEDLDNEGNECYRKPTDKEAKEIKEYLERR